MRPCVGVEALAGLLTASIKPEEATTNMKPAKDDSENDVRTKEGEASTSAS